MPPDLDRSSALDLAAAIRRREVSPTEVMEATLDAIADAGHEIVDHPFDPFAEKFIAGFVHVVNAGRR